MFRLVMLTAMSVLLIAQNVFADDRGIVTTSRFSSDISNVPANHLSHLYNFGNGGPDFIRAWSAASRKASSAGRSSMARICQQDFNAILRKPDPDPIRVKPLPEILEATNRLGISEENVRYTLAAYQSHEGVIRNNRFVTIVEYGRRSNTPRMFIVDLATAEIRSYKVSHGARSGNHGGAATRFSNASNSNASSIGCSLTGGFYSGKHGTSMRFHGLEVGKNDNKCVRSVVMHPGSYVSSGGRSHGCPAVEPNKRSEIYSQIQGGSMYCAFGDQKDNTHLAVEERPPRSKKRKSRRG